MRKSRRDLLCTIGTLTTASVAGCGGTDSQPTPTDSQSTETPTPQQRNVPAWTSWVPSPSALGVGDGYGVFALAPSDIAQYSDSLSADVTDDYDDPVLVDGLGTLGEVDWTISLGPAVQVTVGPSGIDSAGSTFEQLGYERTDTVAGVDIYQRSDADGEIALGAGADIVVNANTRSVDTDAVSAIEAVARDDDRFTDTVPEAATALELTAPGEGLFVRQNATDLSTVDGATVEGFGWQLGQSETTVTAAFVGDETEIDPDAVGSWARESGTFTADTPSIATDGMAVTATGAVQTGVVDFEPTWAEPAQSGRPSAVPQVQWGADYDATQSLLTIRHERGDTVPASQLYVRGSGFTDIDGADQTTAGRWQGTVANESGLAAGDTVTVGATADYTIRLVYEQADSDQSATLAEFDGPDA